MQHKPRVAAALADAAVGNHIFLVSHAFAAINSLQLISKLQDAKKDFEFMVYPGGRHGWPGNKGLHFQNLKTKFIYKNLLEKEVPKDLLR